MPPSPLLRAALGGAAVAAVAVPALIVAAAPRPVMPQAAIPLPKRIVPKTELPPVEPVALADLTPTDARTINAAIPFSSAPNPAARPFRLSGAAPDQARAIDCLAAAVYYEAGDDAVGQRAVAQVVLNRMRHPAFPKTVCGVVFQGSERRTGCQFTFTCDGAMVRYSPSPAAWERARDVARMALGGTVYKPVGHATHYHTDWVVPYWSAKLEKITAVDTHLFFRWAGWWGTPPAFNRGYAGSEPNIPQLARLSPSHQGATQDPATLEAALSSALTVDPASIPASAVPRPTTADGNSFLVTLDKAMAPDAFAALAVRTCGDRAYCKFMAWNDPARTPRALPLSSAQVAAMSFSYLRDESMGFAKALWNCDQYRRRSPVQCMRAQPLAAPSPAPTVAPPPIAAAPTPYPGNPSGPAPLAGVRRRTDATPPPVLAPPATPAARPAVPMEDRR